MPETLMELKRRRSELLDRMAELGNFRAGCITALVRRCGKPGCRCAAPGDPGHGPNMRVTFKVNNKTRSESLSDPVRLRKVQREIEEFRRFQQLCKEFVSVNANICQLTASEGELASRATYR